MLDMPLHAPVTWLVGAELDTGQNQSGSRLQIIDQAFRQPGLLRDLLLDVLLCFPLVRTQRCLQQWPVLRVL